MIRTIALLAASLLLFTLAMNTAAAADEKETRLAELDAYWAEVSRAVQEGDFEAYAATCHEEGVLVSGSKSTSYPLTTALEKWKQGFADTQAGRIKASVQFRLGKRLGDSTTAHETGMFLYTSTTPDGEVTEAYIHFEALLVKKDRWRIIMEYQKSTATRAEWDALAASH